LSYGPITPNQELLYVAQWAQVNNLQLDRAKSTEINI